MIHLSTIKLERHLITYFLMLLLLLLILQLQFSLVLHAFSMPNHRVPIVESFAARRASPGFRRTHFTVSRGHPV